MKKKEIKKVESIIERYGAKINCTIKLMGIIITDPERLDCAYDFDAEIDVKIMDSNDIEKNKARVLEKIAGGDFKITDGGAPSGFSGRVKALLNKKNISRCAIFSDDLDEFIEDLQSEMDDISLDYADKRFGDEWARDMFYEQISISYEYFKDDVLLFHK